MMHTNAAFNQMVLLYLNSKVEISEKNAAVKATFVVSSILHVTAA